MIKSIGVYHLGIPVDDIDRAEGFYTGIMGMKTEQRLGDGNTRLYRLKCGDVDVVLFQRPKPLQRNGLEEDGISHQAFEVAPDAFDEAMELLKKEGYFHSGPVVRNSGRAAYFFDTEGNFQQIHAAPAE
jgi:catechol 2,3-dioxygenase-like lactoylglutathione lyase family enzyme